MAYSARQLRTVEDRSGPATRCQPMWPRDILNGCCGCTTVVADLATLGLLWKTLVDSARQRRTVEDSGRDLPTLYVVWQTVVDSGNEGSGRQWRTLEDSKGQ